MIKKIFKIIDKNKIIILFVFAVAFLLLFYDWYFFYIDANIGTVIYTFTHSGAEKNTVVIISFFKRVVFLSFVVTAASGLIIYGLNAEKAVKKHLRKIIICFIAFCTVLSFSFFQRIQLISYVMGSEKYESLFEKNYVRNAKLTFPKKKRNIIYIYLESMEMTNTSKKYGGAFKTNYIPEMTKLSQKYENFSGNDSRKLNGAYATQGSDFTMASLFSQSTGLPLKALMINEKKYFPSVSSFGKILKMNGYKNVFMSGGDTKFADMNKFLKTHGSFDVYDQSRKIKDSHPVAEKDKHKWGYNDYILYSDAKKKLNELSKSSQPFNLTFMTIDTHYPSGYKCRYCKDKYSYDYMNVMSCASKQLNSFISWCQKQSWYKNTTIIVNGDHPSMSSEYKWKAGRYLRKTYTCYINSAVKRKVQKRRKYSTFDNFPTSLAAIGVKIKGDRLGIGVNLYSSKKTMCEKYGYEGFNNIVSWSYKAIDKIEK